MNRALLLAYAVACVGLAALQPRAAVPALCLAASIAVTGAKRGAAGLLILLLAIAPVGLRVDAMPPSASGEPSTRR